MKISTKLARIAAPAVMLIALTSSASAGTFLQIFQTNASNTDFTITDNAGISNTVAVTSGAVNFDFAVPSALGTGIRAGFLTFSGTSSTLPTVNGGNQAQNGYSGSGSLFDTLTNSVVFTWTFGPTGTATVATGGTGGTFTDSRPPAGEVVMSSTYLNFGNSTAESFSFGLSGATPVFAVGTDGYLANTTTSYVATFDAQPLPSAPEPATLTLFGTALVGLGLVGRKRLARR